MVISYDEDNDENDKAATAVFDNDDNELKMTK
jgi:hypothetical protein